MEKLRFRVIIEQDEDGIYVASVPALPGCHTQAPDLNQLDERIKEAIKVYLGAQKIYKGSSSFAGVYEVEVGI